MDLTDTSLSPYPRCPFTPRPGDIITVHDESYWYAAHDEGKHVVDRVLDEEDADDYAEEECSAANFYQRCQLNLPHTIYTNGGWYLEIGDIETLTRDGVLLFSIRDACHAHERWTAEDMT